MDLSRIDLNAKIYRSIELSLSVIELDKEALQGRINFKFQLSKAYRVAVEP
jgi:hypothetical protein